MRLFLFPTIAFIIFVFCGVSYGPSVKTVYLNQNTTNFASPWELNVYPGDRVNFLTTNGEFSINIPNANSIFEEVSSPNLLIHLNSSNPQSQTYTAKSAESYLSQEYSAYCITLGTYPDAPPRIIRITSQE